MKQFSLIVARNSALGLAAQLAIKLLSFSFSVLIVRSLGTQAYGQYAAVLAFGGLFVFLSDLGLSPYTVREVARWRDTPGGAERIRALYGNVLLLRILLSLLAAALLVTTAWLTGRPIVMVIAIALGALGLIMYSVQGASEAMLSGFERLDLVAGVRVLYQIVFVFVGAALLWAGLGYYGLIFANLLGIALITRVCWKAARHQGLLPGVAAVREWPALLRASIPFGLIGFTLGLSYKFDSVLLNLFRGDAETGYYNAAYNLVFSTVVLSNVINTSLYPSLARQAASAPQSLTPIYERALRYLLALALPIAVGACALADQIVPFLFTAAYTPAVPALQVVIWVVPLMFASEFLGYVVVIGGAERAAARAVIASTSFNVAINILVVPGYGFLGAAVMTVLTESVLVGLYIWMLRTKMRQVNWKHTLVLPLLAALLMGGLALVLRDLPLVLDVALSGVAYLGFLVLLGVIGRDELRFVRGLRRRVEGAVVP
jgi:O-antigen/teichoic acid export membrane protein